MDFLMYCINNVQIWFSEHKLECFPRNDMVYLFPGIQITDEAKPKTAGGQLLACYRLWFRSTELWLFTPDENMVYYSVSQLIQQLVHYNVMKYNNFLKLSNFYMGVSSKFSKVGWLKHFDVRNKRVLKKAFLTKYCW